MPTRLVFHIASPDGPSGVSASLILADDFDTVFGKLYPLNSPSSNLEHRANMEHQLLDGRRFSCQSSMIAWIEDWTEDDA